MSTDAPAIQAAEAEIAQLLADRDAGRYHGGHARIRAARLRLARLKGIHTKEQWEDLKREFDYRCVKCGARRHLDKDHVVPIYQGGSDALSNLQPLCAPCNARKGPDGTNWAIYRREHGFA